MKCCYEDIKNTKQYYKKLYEKCLVKKCLDVYELLNYWNTSAINYLKAKKKYHIIEDR